MMTTDVDGRKQVLGKRVMDAMGWTLSGTAPQAPRFVVIAAPHTSNWDLFFTVCACFALDVPIRWLGKDSLFGYPQGPFLRALGGIPVVRTARRDMVHQMANLLRDETQGRFALVVPPEATRAPVPVWRSGFYRIAEAAQVPIVLGFLDYERKVGGFGPSFVPGGNIEADMERIRAFYAPMKGKFPERFLEPRLREE